MKNQMIQFRNHRKKSVGYFGTIPKNYTKNLIFVSETVRKFNEIFVPLLYLNKIKDFNQLRIKALFVRAKGLEPIRLTAPDPKSGLATNYNTPAELSSERMAKIGI